MSDVSSPTSADRTVFRRGLALTVMTLLMPGSAQLVLGSKRVGRIAIRIWLAVLVVAVLVLVTGYFWRGGLFSLVTNPRVLWMARLALIAGAIGWAFLLLDAWRLSRPLEMHRAHRLWMTGLNGALVVGTAGSMLFVAHLVGVQQGFISTVFAAEHVSKPHDGRYNLLLLGADSGKGRDGMRPDSLTVVSIDGESGKSVMVSLPRNLEDVPFTSGSPMDEEFPRGFDCEDCLLNGVSTWANDHAELFTGSSNPGLDATVDAVEAITGLNINYHAIIDMKGFAQLIDAVGGVRIDVKERTAIGGAPVTGWIEPGEQKLSGYETLWYARSRVYTDDWSRMGRQKCVLNAMLHQLDPKSVLLNAQAVAESGKVLLQTNIPSRDISTFMDLALKARTQKIATVSLVPPVIYTGNPDYDKVRRIIKQAIDASEGDPESKMLTASLRLPAATSDPRGANQSADLDAAC